MPIELLTFQEQLPAYMRKASVEKAHLKDEFMEWLYGLDDYSLYWSLGSDGGTEALMLALSERNTMMFKLVWV